jgi:hypothetical protein
MKLTSKNTKTAKKRRVVTRKPSTNSKAWAKSSKNVSKSGISGNANITDADMKVCPKIATNESIDTIFSTPTKTRKTKKGIVVADAGKPFSGKTRRLLSTVKVSKKGIEEEVPTWNLKSKNEEVVIETMLSALKSGRLLTGTPLYVVGTEESTEECLYSEDNWEYFADYIDEIKLKEIFILRDTDKILETGVNGEESFKLFNKIMILFERAAISGKKYAIGIDNGSTILGWLHEVLRRSIHRKPITAKEQGIPPRHWFYRNTKMESMSLDFKNLNKLTWIVYKMAKDREGNTTIEPKWHEDTSGYLATVYMYSQLIERRKLIITEFRKCRPNFQLVGEWYQWLSANKIMALMLGLQQPLFSSVSVPEDIRNDLMDSYETNDVFVVEDEGVIVNEDSD